MRNWFLYWDPVVRGAITVFMALFTILTWLVGRRLTAMQERSQKIQQHVEFRAGIESWYDVEDTDEGPETDTGVRLKVMNLGDSAVYIEELELAVESMGIQKSVKRPIELIVPSYQAGAHAITEDVFKAAKQIAKEKGWNTKEDSGWLDGMEFAIGGKLTYFAKGEKNRPCDLETVKIAYAHHGWL